MSKKGFEETAKEIIEHPYLEEAIKLMLKESE